MNNSIKKLYLTDNQHLFVIIPLLLFTLAFFYSAYLKNFPTDTFYSWVYTQNCSYWEILTLKDTGIGHPPLFHLLQKLVQDILPGYHFLHIRLVNFIAGSVFIIFLIPYLNKLKSNHFFLISLALSATILDTFILARMWGLVVLFSLLLFLNGEKYLKEPSISNLLKLIIIYFFGLFADYNFILLAPYFFIIIFKSNRIRKVLFFIGIAFFIFAWIHTFRHAVINDGVTLAGYNLLHSLLELNFLFMQLVFNFKYLELMALPLFILVLFLIIEYKNKVILQVDYFFIVIFFMTVLFLLSEANIIRVRSTLFFTPIFIFLFYKVIKDFSIDLIWSDVSIRIIVSTFLGSMIILIINPIFWTDLTQQRFILIFFPMVLVLLYKHFSIKILTLLSCFVILSGIDYSFSSRIHNSFPATTIDYGKPVVYEAARAYATQYLKNRHHENNPKFLCLDSFRKSCRVCLMGTDQIDYTKLDFFRIITWKEEFPDSLLDQGFKIQNMRPFGLTRLDQWQMKYLTPTYKSQHFFLYDMLRFE